MPDTSYSSLCQNCVTVLHPVMLTGYCLLGLSCGRCGQVSPLALVQPVTERRPANVR